MKKKIFVSIALVLAVVAGSVCVSAQSPQQPGRPRMVRVPVRQAQSTVSGPLTIFVEVEGVKSSDEAQVVIDVVRDHLGVSNPGQYQIVYNRSQARHIAHVRLGQCNETGTEREEVDPSPPIDRKLAVVSGGLEVTGSVVEVFGGYRKGYALRRSADAVEDVRRSTNRPLETQIRHDGYVVTELQVDDFRPIKGKDEYSIWYGSESRDIPIDVEVENFDTRFPPSYRVGGELWVKLASLRNKLKRFQF